MCAEDLLYGEVRKAGRYCFPARPSSLQPPFDVSVRSCMFGRFSAKDIQAAYSGFVYVQSVLNKELCDVEKSHFD